MLAVVLIVSFLLGSIPNGLIFGKLFWKKDLRRYGSGNVGATNAWRVLGKKAGILIFVLDFLKGELSVFLAEWLIGTPLSMVLAGFMAIIGHSFSPFLQFKGGKGVATGLGVIATLMPSVTAIAFFSWLIIVLTTRYVSLASMAAAVLVPILAAILHYRSEFIIFGVVAALFIIFRHRDNIIRLQKGSENKI